MIVFLLPHAVQKRKEKEKICIERSISNMIIRKKTRPVPKKSNVCKFPGFWMMM